MRYHIRAGNSPDDLAIDTDTDVEAFIYEQSRRWPYVKVALLVPISSEAIDMALLAQEETA